MSAVRGRRLRVGAIIVSAVATAAATVVTSGSVNSADALASSVSTAAPVVNNVSAKVTRYDGWVAIPIRKAPQNLLQSVDYSVTREPLHGYSRIEQPVSSANALRYGFPTALLWYRPSGRFIGTEKVFFNGAIGDGPLTQATATLTVQDVVGAVAKQPAWVEPHPGVKTGQIKFPNVAGVHYTYRTSDSLITKDSRDLADQNFTATVPGGVTATVQAVLDDTSKRLIGTNRWTHKYFASMIVTGNSSSRLINEFTVRNPNDFAVRFAAPGDSRPIPAGKTITVKAAQEKVVWSAVNDEFRWVLRDAGAVLTNQYRPGASVLFRCYGGTRNFGYVTLDNTASTRAATYRISVPHGPSETVKVDPRAATRVKLTKLPSRQYLTVTAVDGLLGLSSKQLLKRMTLRACSGG